MQLYTIADITPNGSAVTLASKSAAGSPTEATWLAFTATGTSIRVGDANVGASRGLLLETGSPLILGVRGDSLQRPYDLTRISVYGASGTDKVSVTFGVG